MTTFIDSFSNFDEPLDTTKDKHSYRVVMYNKSDVDEVEKQAIKEILNKEDFSKYSDAFFVKAQDAYPDFFQSLPQKKKRGKKSNIYFVEEIGKYLWVKWHESQNSDDRNDFLTYCYPLIDGVIFKYQRHKHGLSYDEIFQSAIIKVIQAMDKFNPNREVGRDEQNNPIYARIFTYITMCLNFSITTLTMSYGAEKITTTSYDNLLITSGSNESVTDAHIVFQEFLLFLDSFLSSIENETHRLILEKLALFLKDPTQHPKIANNLVFTLKNECGVKIKDVLDALEYIQQAFGPLNILSRVERLSDVEKS